MAVDDLKEMVVNIVKRVELSKIEADREAGEKVETEETRMAEVSAKA